MPKTKPAYPAEFRAEAVRLIRSGLKSVPQAARDLEVSEQSLRTWVRQAEIDTGRKDGLTTEEHTELRSLRRRVKVLEEERKILLKAAAFFAKETGQTP
ncbi:MAG: transposase [Actinomycetota bacterium]